MRSALAFLTPLGGARTPSPAALPWFPVAGVAIGAVLGGIWWGAGRVWPATVAAGLVVAADLGLTGMLHFDGLVDSADGLLPHLPRERRLEVMAAPDVGAFGIAVAGAVLLLRWSSLAAIHPRLLLLAGLWCVSRSVMAVIALVMPYARREGGLATAFLGPGSRPLLI
ncbi:MAG: adenosylcobinamide-GDP ribazoletransferase, partial [Acidimicrobiaceae bacterium]|nr:adenosylcobinamide-GDP ribazoletransferase [Acidimicrobiaceae bacterium]